MGLMVGRGGRERQGDLAGEAGRGDLAGEAGRQGRSSRGGRERRHETALHQQSDRAESPVGGQPAGYGEFLARARATGGLIVLGLAGLATIIGGGVLLAQALATF
ncbi:hypothetical protein INS90_00585 [Trueperella pecoris]|uniref:Uncharacterized protein n=1 Tax=Trueperella pecoris TaxID=2733571 RepID=A0A7M1R2X8_9ACTO|nr:hypothetical protein [Trueperella pecoris]QOR47847.1 hypothetical protein INS90_00585 [Trueperella pecoris]